MQLKLHLKVKEREAGLVISRGVKPQIKVSFNLGWMKVNINVTPLKVNVKVRQKLR